MEPHYDNLANASSPSAPGPILALNSAMLAAFDIPRTTCVERMMVWASGELRPCRQAGKRGADFVSQGTHNGVELRTPATVGKQGTDVLSRNHPTHQTFCVDATNHPNRSESSLATSQFSSVSSPTTVKEVPLRESTSSLETPVWERDGEYAMALV